jgi:hypothetical protein
VGAKVMALPKKTKLLLTLNELSKFTCNVYDICNRKAGLI